MNDNEIDALIREAFDARVPDEARLQQLLPAPEGSKTSWWMGLVAAAVLLVIVAPALSRLRSPAAPELLSPAPLSEETRLVSVDVDPEHVADGRLASGDVVDLYVVRQDAVQATLEARVRGTTPEGGLTVWMSAPDAARLVQGTDAHAIVWPAEHVGGQRLVMVAPQPLDRPLVEQERVVVMGREGRLAHPLYVQEPRERSFRVQVSREEAAQIAASATWGYRVLVPAP